MLRKIAYNGQKELKKLITNLLESAFPEDERPPTNRFFSSLKRKGNELFAYYDEDEFIGFTSLTFYQDICFIFFLAVQEEKRHQGYGGQILEDIKTAYHDCVILLCYEEVNPQYQNYEERVLREKFYQKHGFKDNKMKTDEFGVIFQTVYIGQHLIEFETYLEVITIAFGEYVRDYVKEVR